MIFSHPAFIPYQSLIEKLNHDYSIASLNALADSLNLHHVNGNALSFESGDMPGHAAEYEQRIFSSGCVPTRENNPHDLLNALAWLLFPKLKSALNIRHCKMLEHPDERKQRGKVRDHLTLLDESGVLIASPRRDLLNLLQEKRWVELFWQAREEVVAHMTFIVVGHGLLEKCMQPFASMTGKCLLMETGETLPEKLDSLAAVEIEHASMLTLPPLPVLGIPDWDDNNNIRYYQNTQVFRI
jgi:hypothetical protein